MSTLTEDSARVEREEECRPAKRLGGWRAPYGIAPPCDARRVLPLFPPPGYHQYDAYQNCFQFRPELRQTLCEAARVAEIQRSERRPGRRHSNTGSAGHEVGSARRETLLPCRCALDAAQLFATPQDVPDPPLPLSRCELHEVLRALPPRWQSYPWRKCFDTASDGFSLSTLYRHMETVKIPGSDAKTVTFGVIFASSREKEEEEDVRGSSPVSAATSAYSEAAASHLLRLPFFPIRDAGDLPSRSGGGTPLPGKTAPHARSLPCRGPRPYSVIGCFAPEAPGLAFHAANVYFGSPDTFVFRLEQLSNAGSRGAWMRADMEQQQQQRRASEEQHRSTTELSRERKHQGAPSHHVGGCTNDPATVRSFTREGVSFSWGRTDRPSKEPTYGYAWLGTTGDADTAVQVPSPTCTTIEHPTRDSGETRGNDGRPLPRRCVGEAAAPSSQESSGPLSRSPSLVRCHSPFSTGVSGGSHGWPARYPGRPRALPVPPDGPILTKYGWSGRPDNKKFMVCNPHFCAIGGGNGGAAVYVEADLQYGTSSRWCDTFDAPCLFGGSPSDGVPAALAPTFTTKTTTSAVGGVPSSTDGSHGSAAPVFGDVRDRLPHREFAIDRLVWFSVTEERGQMRSMSATTSASLLLLPAGASTAVAYECGCGRTCYDEQRVGVSAPLSAPGACPVETQRAATDSSEMVAVTTTIPAPLLSTRFGHHCDLLPVDPPT